MRPAHAWKRDSVRDVIVVEAEVEVEDGTDGGPLYTKRKSSDTHQVMQEKDYLVPDRDAEALYRWVLQHHLTRVVRCALRKVWGEPILCLGRTCSV